MLSEQISSDHDLQSLSAAVRTESGDGSALLDDIENNPVCSVFFDPALPGVTVLWKRYATSNQIRFVYENIIRLLQQHRAHKVLADDTALPTIGDADRDWIIENWLPRVIAAGFRAGAHKLPAWHFGKVSVETIKAITAANVTVRGFDDLDEARTWLRSLVIP